MSMGAYILMPFLTVSPALNADVSHSVQPSVEEQSVTAIELKPLEDICDFDSPETHLEPCGIPTPLLPVESEGDLVVYSVNSSEPAEADLSQASDQAPSDQILRERALNECTKVGNHLECVTAARYAIRMGLDDKAVLGDVIAMCPQVRRSLFLSDLVALCDSLGQQPNPKPEVWTALENTIIAEKVDQDLNVTPISIMDLLSQPIE